jgi:hypothetical protein
VCVFFWGRTQCVPEEFFDVIIRANGVAFNQVPMKEGVRCWHDRTNYQYQKVPSELMPGTLFQGAELLCCTVLSVLNQAWG